MLGFVFQTLPHISASGREGLDALLATSAFTEEIQVFFVGDGVLQLKKDQNLDALGSKDYIKAFGLLELYDVEEIYVCETSLNSFGLTQADLVIDATLVGKSEIRQYWQACNKLISF